MQDRARGRDWGRTRGITFFYDFALALMGLKSVFDWTSVFVHE